MTITAEDIQASWPYFRSYLLISSSVFVQSQTKVHLDKGDHQSQRRRLYNRAVSLLQDVHTQVEEAVFALVAERFLEGDSTAPLLSMDDLTLLMDREEEAYSETCRKGFLLHGTTTMGLIVASTVVFEAIDPDNQYEGFRKWQMLCRQLRATHPELPDNSETRDFWRWEIARQLMGEERFEKFITETLRRLGRSPARELRPALDAVMERSKLDQDSIITPKLLKQLRRRVEDNIISTLFMSYAVHKMFESADAEEDEDSFPLLPDL